MIKKTNLNLILVIILYIVYVIGLIFAVLITNNINDVVIVEMFSIANILMYILVPLSIIVSRIYFIKKKNLRNIFILTSTLLSI